MSQVDSMGVPVDTKALEQQVQNLTRDNHEIALKYTILYKNYTTLVEAVKASKEKQSVEWKKSLDELRDRNKSRTKRLTSKVTELQGVIAQYKNTETDSKVINISNQIHDTHNGGDHAKCADCETKIAIIAEKDKTIGDLTQEKDNLSTEFKRELADHKDESNDFAEGVGKVNDCLDCAEKDEAIEALASELEQEKERKAIEEKFGDENENRNECERCAEKDQRIVELETENLNDKHETKDIADKSSALEVECAEYRVRLEQLQEASAEKDIQIEELLSEKANKNDDTADSNTTIDELRDTCVEQGARIDKLLADNETLKTEYSRISQDQETKIADLQLELESGRTSLCDDCTEKNSNIEELTYKCDEKDSRIAELEAEVASSQCEECGRKNTTIEDLRKCCDEKDARIKELEIECADLEDLTQLCDDKNTRIGELEKELENYSSSPKESGACIDCADKDAVIDELSNELDKAGTITGCSECVEKSTTISKLEGEKITLEQALEGWEKEDTSKSAGQSDADDQPCSDCLDKDGEISALAEELEKDCDECANTASRIEELSNEVEKRDRTILEITDELDTRDKTIVELQEDLDARDLTIASLREAETVQDEAPEQAPATNNTTTESSTTGDRSEETVCAACAEKDAEILRMAQDLEVAESAAASTQTPPVTSAFETSQGAVASESKRGGLGGTNECEECEGLQCELEVAKDDLEALRAQLETMENADSTGECIACLERAATEGDKAESGLADVDAETCSKCAQLEATIDELEEELEGKKKPARGTGECTVCSEKDERIESLEAELEAKHSSRKNEFKAGSETIEGVSASASVADDADVREVDAQDADGDGWDDSELEIEDNEEQMYSISAIEAKDALIDNLKREIENLKNDDVGCAKCSEKDVSSQTADGILQESGEQECQMCEDNKETLEHKDKALEEKHAEVEKMADAIKALEADLEVLKALNNDSQKTDSNDHSDADRAQSDEEAELGDGEEKEEDNAVREVECGKCQFKDGEIEERDELIEELRHELEVSRQNNNTKDDVIEEKEVMIEVLENNIKELERDNEPKKGDETECAKCAEKVEELKAKDDIIEEKEVMIEVLLNNIKELEADNEPKEGDETDCAKCAEKDNRIKTLETIDNEGAQTQDTDAENCGSDREQACRKCVQHEEAGESRDSMLQAKDAELEEKIEEIKTLQADLEALKARQEGADTRSVAKGSGSYECAKCKRKDAPIVFVRPPKDESIEELQRLAALAKPHSRGLLDYLGLGAEPPKPCKECKEKDDIIDDLERDLWYKRPGVVVFERPPKDESLETLQMLAKKQVSQIPRPITAEPVVQILTGMFVGLFYAMQTDEHWRDYRFI